MQEQEVEKREEKPSKVAGVVHALLGVPLVSWQVQSAVIQGEKGGVCWNGPCMHQVSQEHMIMSFLSCTLQ